MAVIEFGNTVEKASTRLVGGYMYRKGKSSYSVLDARRQGRLDLRASTQFVPNPTSTLTTQLDIYNGDVKGGEG